MVKMNLLPNEDVVENEIDIQQIGFEMLTENGKKEFDEIKNIFNRYIGDDSICLSFKWNDEDLPDYIARMVLAYVLTIGNPIAWTIGLHEKGKLEKPHFHLNFILEDFGDKKLNTLKSGPSKSRIAFLKKAKLPSDLFQGLLSMKANRIDVGKPKWYPLAYPLKEGNLIYAFSIFGKDGFRNEFSQPLEMCEKHSEFLMEVGTSLFAAKQSEDEAKRLAKEKSNTFKFNLLEFCKTNRNQFSDLDEMRKFVDREYYRKLPFLEKPDLSNLKKACMIIACELGIFSSDML